jgi:single-strand DNA-binding protein
VSSANRVILVGRLGRTPETRYTGSGQAVCNFSLATDESFTDKSGERQKRVEWHNIVAWSKTAEICQQYLHKGSLVYVEGRIQGRDYESQGGKKHVTEIVISDMRMLGPKDSGRAENEQVAEEDIPF